jgi:hypothetical protein
LPRQRTHPTGLSVTYSFSCRSPNGFRGRKLNNIKKIN